jgi:hypothetical protein
MRDWGRAVGCADVKEFLVYTAARFAVFAVCTAVAFGLFWVVGGGDDVPVLWPLLLGAITSVMVSAWLLRDMRDRFAARVQARAERAVRAQEQNQNQSADGAHDEA